MGRELCRKAGSGEAVERARLAGEGVGETRRLSNVGRGAVWKGKGRKGVDKGTGRRKAWRGREPCRKASSGERVERDGKA